MTRVNGRTVLVMGGTSGIVLEVALAFNNEGAQVVASGRGKQARDAAGAALDAGALAIRNDAGDLKAPPAQAVALTGAEVRLDPVFFSADIAKLGPFTSIKPGLWGVTVAINAHERTSSVVQGGLARP